MISIDELMVANGWKYGDYLRVLRSWTVVVQEGDIFQIIPMDNRAKVVYGKIEQEFASRQIVLKPIKCKYRKAPIFCDAANFGNRFEKIDRAEAIAEMLSE